MISPSRSQRSKFSWVAQWGTMLLLASSTRGASVVGAEDRHRLARLHQQRLVRLQLAQAAQDGVEGSPSCARPAAAAIDDQVVRVEGHLGSRLFCNMR
jgi:hypothetical protein